MCKWSFRFKMMNSTPYNKCFEGYSMDGISDNFKIKTKIEFEMCKWSFRFKMELGVSSSALLNLTPYNKCFEGYSMDGISDKL